MTGLFLNALASLNKAIYQSSKLIMPPWPIDYELLHPDGSQRWGYADEPVFSPNGSQIAYCIIRKFENDEVKEKRSQFLIKDVDFFVFVFVVLITSDRRSS